MAKQRNLQNIINNSSRLPTRYFGEYKLIAELARGGMGRVFLALRQREAGFERLYALKVMHDHLADEIEAVTMLIDEAKIASKLHHPNVVPIMDIGNQDGNYYLVMDYVEGCSLSELMRRTKTDRPARRVVTLLLDALRGLHAAHELTDSSGDSLSLIHRDFSPQNLLVGIDGTCRVTDFGIAKASARLTHTRSTVQKGKISYMSPEQLTEEVELDRRADIWAAGVVLWQALTGEHPFKGPSEASTIHMILERRVPPPSTFGLTPPSCLDELCLKALTRDREGRFETAQEMADELQRVAVRNDLLATQSEVAKWVSLSFEKELTDRRQLIRSIKEHGADIAWLNAPTLPRLATTPSTGTRARVELSSPEALPLESPAPAQIPSTSKPKPSPTGTRKRGGSRRGIKMLLGVVLGSVAGFIICFTAFTLIRGALTNETAQETGGSPEVTERQPVSIAAETDREEPVSQVEPVQIAASTPTQASSSARISLVNVPMGATIRLDGIPVDGPEITVPIDGRERVVRVDHPDFIQWRQNFIASEDTSLQVRLRPLRRRVTPSKRATPQRRSKLVRDPGF